MSKKLGILGAAALLLIPTNAALAVGGNIENGNFETGAPAATTIDGWTSIKERVDLGVDSIAGCRTVDTSNYANLRDWYVLRADSEDDEGWDSTYGRWNTDEDGPLPVNSNPRVNNDSLVLELQGVTYETSLRDGNNLLDDEGNPLPASFNRDSQVLELYSGMNLAGDHPVGYVVHGPAVYSEIFSAKTIDDLQFDWAASDISDDHHVFGYLLNTDTCAQKEVIDSTGEISEWRTTSVAVPANGNYRFVFVSGTFDYSFGGVAGAFLLLDDVSLVENEERAEALANTGPEIQALLLAGLVALAAGSAFLAVSRRKRSW